MILKAARFQTAKQRKVQLALGMKDTSKSVNKSPIFEYTPWKSDLDFAMSIPENDPPFEFDQIFEMIDDEAAQLIECVCKNKIHAK